MRALDVGPDKERRTRVMEVGLTDAIVKGLRRRAWMERLGVAGGVLSRGMER